MTLLDQSIIYSKGIITNATVTDMLGMIDPGFMDNIFKVVLSQGDIRPIVASLESYEVGQVLDEITIYIKQRMLLNDLKYDLYLFDRFFKIIADSKQLLNMNSDGGFVLILTLSKMIQAVSIKTIDEVINQINKVEVTPESVELQEPQDILNQEVGYIEENRVISNIEQASSVNTSNPSVARIEPQAMVIPEPIPEPVVEVIDPAVVKFKELIANIYEKS